MCAITTEHVRPEIFAKWFALYVNGLRYKSAKPGIVASVLLFLFPLFSKLLIFSNLEDTMKPIGTKARNWLLTFHILSVSVWIGTAAFTILLRLLNNQMTSAEGLRLLHILSNKSDQLIYPSVAGVLITSLMIATMTKWGFFRFRWMTVVWILFVANIVMGATVLSPLKKNILAIAEIEGLAALQNPIYTRNHALLTLGGITQVLLLAAGILIVKLKPWTRRKV